MKAILLPPTQSPHLTSMDAQRKIERLEREKSDLLEALERMVQITTLEKKDRFGSPIRWEPQDIIDQAKGAIAQAG